MSRFNPFEGLPALESISVQNGRLFQELTLAIGKLRKGDSYTTEAILDSDIMNIVRDYTGMRIAFHVDANYGHACIQLPALDRNHPFVDGYWKAYGHFETGAQIIRAMKGQIKGSVDRTNSKVGGIYSEIQADIYFGKSFLQGKMYSDGELAAVLLHELGHLYTYFEYLGTTVFSSHVIAAAAKAVMEIEDQAERAVVLKEAQQVLGVEIPDTDRLSMTPKAARSYATQTVLISAYAEKSRSEMGTNVYDARSCEQLADQFATRHGAGKELVTALDKLYRSYSHRSTLSMAEHVILEVGKMILFLCGLFLLTIPLVLWLLVSNPTRKIYDDPQARVRLVRQQLNEELKEKGLPDSRRVALLSDIAICEEIEGSLDDKRTVLEFIWTTVMPSGRAAANQELVQKQVEDLLNNQLFVMSAKLKVGA